MSNIVNWQIIDKIRSNRKIARKKVSINEIDGQKKGQFRKLRPILILKFLKKFFSCVIFKI